MMANRELPIYVMQLYQKLKQKFPDVPDNVIFKYAKMFPDDIQKCIDYLNEQKNIQISTENRTVRNKSISVTHVQDSHNSYIQNRAYINQTPYNGIIDGQTGINGISSLPCDPAQSLGTNAAYLSKYGHSPNARSSSISGSTIPTTTAENHSNITNLHPRSAPVMPTHYEPFHMEYRGTAEVSFKPNYVCSSTSQVPLSSLSSQRFPPTHHDIFYEQQDRQQQQPYNQYKYEMHVHYNQALICHQQNQMAKLRQHLMGEKQKLDMIKSDVLSLEQELQRRKRYLQNPIIPCEQIAQLRRETKQLRIECDCMSKEVDSLVKGEVPLGETRMDFYESLNPGQCGTVGIPLKRSDRSTSSKSHSSESTPPPPPPLPWSDVEDRQWSCSTCTFLNNSALDKCEICEMPRLSRGTHRIHSSTPLQSKSCYCHPQIVS